MNSEMNPAEVSGSLAIAYPDTVVLDGSGVQAVRYRLHELANVFTGVVIAGGLLSQYLEGGSLQHYATDILECSERGCGLVREIRSQLMAACGEVEAASNGNAAESIQGQ